MRNGHDVLQTAETWLALAEVSATDDNFQRASAQATIALAQILLAQAYTQQKRHTVKGGCVRAKKAAGR